MASFTIQELHERRKQQVARYSDNLRIYRLIDRRNASIVTGKANRRETR